MGLEEAMVSDNEKHAITCISLGMSCQTFHQLRRFSELSRGRVVAISSPFDWLISPLDHSLNWLEAGTPVFGANDLIIDRDRVFWPEFGMWFWHGFFTKLKTSGQIERKLDIAKNFEFELSKLQHKIENLKNVPPDVHVFVSNTQTNLIGAVFDKHELDMVRFTRESIQRLEKTVEILFGPNATLHVITNELRSFDSVRALGCTTVLEPDTSEWKGDDAQWNRILCEKLQLSLV